MSSNKPPAVGAIASIPINLAMPYNDAYVISALQQQYQIEIVDDMFDLILEKGAKQLCDNDIESLLPDYTVCGIMYHSPYILFQ